LSSKHLLNPFSPDETDAAFWEEMHSFGWSRIDHEAERTEERYGKWYVMLIDNVALSMGVGFVGSGSSTFSLLNARRVEDWNDGITEIVSHYID